jgi:hypothetical protein
VSACVQVCEPDGKKRKQVRVFASLTGDLLGLADWLHEQSVTHVAMKPIGVYWGPVYAVLEDSQSVSVRPAKAESEDHVWRRYAVSRRKVYPGSAESRGGAAHQRVQERPQQFGKNSLTTEEGADERRAIGQRKRNLIERVFGWGKLDRPLRQVKLRSLKRVDWIYRMTLAVYNLVRIRRLIATEVPASYYRSVPGGR